MWLRREGSPNHKRTDQQFEHARAERESRDAQRAGCVLADIESGPGPDHLSPGRTTRPETPDS